MPELVAGAGFELTPFGAMSPTSHQTAPASDQTICEAIYWRAGDPGVK
jgi:hypothetical protein